MTRVERPDADTVRRIVELRRTFHAYPELAFEEERTAATIMNELDRLGIDYVYGGVGGGVVARLEGAPGAPVIALRAEMDALPTDEHTNLPFASKVPGRMHACGHDSHMAMLLGAAAMHRRDPPPGTVVYVFQPAEERGGGSRVVLDSGALDDIGAIFACHVTHHYAVGQIMVTSGVVTAHSDRFSIRVRGAGGHAARPHEAIDAVIVAGMLINSIQSLVSRETDPVHPTVVTIGRVVAGSAANVIAEDALLEGSIRTTLPSVREHIHSGLERLCRAAGELHRARVEVEIRSGYPPVVNTPAEADIAARAARLVVGPAGVISQEHPSMGSEDFAFYLERIPGCYVRLGARFADDLYVPLHSPEFDINEDVLPVGASFLDQVARSAIEGVA